MATQPVTVECIEEYDPPMVRVTIAGQSFDISTVLYEYIWQQMGWPTNPCAGVGA